ncbi:MAG: AAA family ATPase [Pirellulaceae bacterium]|nr:AAA family ATPase [Pirellulaceae bacterium]
MYETYWQLTQKPFDNAADPRFYYPGESHQAALLKLRYAIENRRGGALLCGPSGSGKTMLTTMLRGALDECFAPFVHVVFPQMPANELLAFLADEFDGETAVEGKTDVVRSVRRLERALNANAKKGRHAVVAIDEAHLLDGPESFEALRLLMNFEYNGSPALTLLLIGHPSLLPTINRMPQWEERLSVKCLLRPFNEPETAGYINHRLRVAGAGRPLVEPDAVPTLQELTHGIARRINRLCDLALLVGYAEEQPSLGAEHFETVSRELVAVSPD